MEQDLIRKLAGPAESTIVFLVMDGLGGLPGGPAGLTELETAKTPNLDALAAEGILGLHEPVGPGVTPGSGPSHLALFGYDPLTHDVGRGVIAASGIGFPLSPGDVAARGNFCTVNDEDTVIDRRAGRINTEKNRELCRELGSMEFPGIELFVETVKEHRFLLVMRGDSLTADISDTDPLQTGRKVLQPVPLTEGGEKGAEIVKDFLGRAKDMLSGHHPANMVILRGFSSKPDWPSMEDVYGLRCAALAGYPMYRGIARLLGMKSIETNEDLPEKIEKMRDLWDEFDFFFLHVKGTDSAGEDGNFEKKVSIIEEVDTHFPRILSLGPDVVVVTGDHSTPSSMGFHSWHPVPVLLWSGRCRPDSVERFAESACLAGGLGPRMATTHLMAIALAHAGRLKKFGA